MFGTLSAERFIALCERTFSYAGAMRAEAEALANEDPTDQLREEFDDEDLEDEVEPQQLDDLQLGMEVRPDASGDGARVAGEG